MDLFINTSILSKHKRQLAVLPGARWESQHLFLYCMLRETDYFIFSSGKIWYLTDPTGEFCFVCFRQFHDQLQVSEKASERRQKWEGELEPSMVLDTCLDLISFLGICRTVISMYPKGTHHKKGNRNSHKSFSCNQHC